MKEKIAIKFAGTSWLYYFLSNRVTTYENYFFYKLMRLKPISIREEADATLKHLYDHAIKIITVPPKTSNKSMITRFSKKIRLPSFVLPADSIQEVMELQ